MSHKQPPESDAVPLTRLRAKLARPRGYKRVDSLLSADDAASAVAALSVPELYQLVKEVGFGDTYELIALATPEQVRGCVDFDAWDRDRLQTEAVKPWLAAIIDAGYERLGQVWEQLDSELTALILQRWTKIYDLSLGEEPDEDPLLDTPFMTTPDTFFAVRFIADEDTNTLCRQLIDDLYRADLIVVRHALMAARTEPSAALEEQGYRWRSGRMADLGYADFYDALAVYRPLDPGSVQIGEATEDRFSDAAEGDDARRPGTLPVPFAEQVIGRSFLARALDRIHDEAEAERLETALVVLVNKVLSAAHVSPGDTDAVAVGTEHATATLALGLERVSGGDLDRAAEALRTVSLTRLHRVGYTITLPLARFARALAARAATAGGASEALLTSLLSARPFFPRELDEPAGTGRRPFESTEDMGRAAIALTLLALRVAVADALGVDLVEAANMGDASFALDDHARTAVARVLTGGELDSAPLSDAELDRLRSDALVDGAIGPDLRAGVRERLRTLLAGAQVTAGLDFVPALVDEWVDEIERLVGNIPAGQSVDPRFVSGLIVSAGRA